MFFNWFQKPTAPTVDLQAQQALEKLVHQQQNELKTLHEQFDALNQNNTDNRTHLNNLDTRINNDQSKKVDWDQRINNMDTKVTNLSNDLSGHNQQLNKLSNQINQLSQTFAETLKKISEPHFETFNQIDPPKTIQVESQTDEQPKPAQSQFEQITNQIHDLTDQVKAMPNQYQTNDNEPLLLPLFPKAVDHEKIDHLKFDSPLHQITEHIIGIANVNHLPITIVQLNNILVITLALLASTNDDDEQLKASYEKTPPYISQYGFTNPRVVDAYYYQFGTKPIEEAEAKTDPQLDWTNSYIIKLLGQNIIKLIQIVQAKPWYRTYQVGDPLKYSDLKRFFKVNSHH